MNAPQRIFPILRRKPKMDEDAGDARSQPLDGHIEFQHIDFSYPTRPHVLVFHGFNLDIPRGEAGCGSMYRG